MVERERNGDAPDTAVASIADTRATRDRGAERYGATEVSTPISRASTAALTMRETARASTGGNTLSWSMAWLSTDPWSSVSRATGTSREPRP